MKSLTVVQIFCLFFASCVIGLYSCDGTLQHRVQSRPYLKIKFRKVRRTFKSVQLRDWLRVPLFKCGARDLIIAFLLILAPIESYSRTYLYFYSILHSLDSDNKNAIRTRTSEILHANLEDKTDWSELFSVLNKHLFPRTSRKKKKKKNAIKSLLCSSFWSIVSTLY